jgi:hypothetical protein
MSGDVVNRQDEAIRRALGALRADEDPDHPGHEVLEAYVEGRLSPDERAEVDRLAARSVIVAEDLADLQAVSTALATPRSRGFGRARIAAMAAVAACAVLGVWLTGRPALQDSLRAVTQLTAAEQDRVTAALSRGRVNVPASAAALIRPEGTLLGAPVSVAAVTLIGPTGTYLSTARPAFTWSDASADAYTVAVFDENFAEVARSPRVTGTSWTPAADLPRSKTYSWQLTVHRGNRDDIEPKPPRPEARFAIVDQATEAAVEAMRQRLADEPLALGVLLAESGLLDAARQQLERAAAAPADAETARRLLDSLNQGTPITTKPAQ